MNPAIPDYSLVARVRARGFKASLEEERAYAQVQAELPSLAAEQHRTDVEEAFIFVKLREQVRERSMDLAGEMIAQGDPPEAVYLGAVEVVAGLQALLLSSRSNREREWGWRIVAALGVGQARAGTEAERSERRMQALLDEVTAEFGPGGWPNMRNLAAMMGLCWAASALVAVSRV